jgi:hypothetical protein
MDEFQPPTQPEGALTPPPRVPPNALATAELPPRPPTSTARTGRWNFRRLLNGALDQLDSIGDRIADAVGLR